MSDEATPATKGTVFGFHRSMDTIGAVLGPVAALIYLYRYPGDYKMLFILALVPGLLAVACSFLLKDKFRVVRTGAVNVRFFSFFKYWNQSAEIYRRLVVGLLIFTLVNSSDVFLLLKAKQAGLNDSQVLMVYIFYNLIYAAFAFPVGVVADKVGLKKIFLFGLVLFIMVYTGMAFASLPVHFYILFFLYGLYASATEGVSKAWISNISQAKDTATAIGSYAAFQSIVTMLASSLAGLTWYLFGPGASFLLSAAIAAVVVVYISSIPGKA